MGEVLLVGDQDIKGAGQDVTQISRVQVKVAFLSLMLSNPENGISKGLRTVVRSSLKPAKTSS